MEQSQEFWRWSERSWHDRDLDWRSASALTVGVDVGSVSSQAVLLADGKVLCFHSTRTGSSSPDGAMRAFEGAAKPVGAGLVDVLSVPVEEIGERSFRIDEEPQPVSNVCTVFAESEATSLLPAESVLDPQIAGALGAALFAHSLHREAEKERAAK